MNATVLVVEDNPLNRKLVRDGLGAGTYEGPGSRARPFTDMDVGGNLPTLGGGRSVKSDFPIALGVAHRTIG